MAKVLIIGNGGREHAFATVLRDSPSVTDIYWVDPNAGVTSVKYCHAVHIEPSDTARFVKEQGIDLVVIGPEAPLADGLADIFRAQDIAVLGPSKAAAQLETSKSYATAFMQEHDIPVPPSWVTHDAGAAMAAVTELGAEQAVIKADGLAHGKGVVLPNTLDEAREVITKMFEGIYDTTGETVVIQKRFHGPEVSAFALSDGDTYTFISILAQDHKRLLAGDTGPNTGGMGAYAPLPSSIIAAPQIEKLHLIAEKTIAGMKRAGQPYQGILYIGAMLAEELQGDPVMIEYNVRFGDPEAEVILPLLARNGVDIYDLFYRVATGTCGSCSLPATIPDAAVAICLAAKGYPDKAEKGVTIEGLDKTYPNVQIFQAGTTEKDGAIVTNGGRVLYVTGFGSDLEAARQAATAAIGEQGVHFAGMQYRDDIGYRALGT
jgi:phosphoribosylamine---glycine ligase